EVLVEPRARTRLEPVGGGIDVLEDVLFVRRVVAVRGEWMRAVRHSHHGVRARYGGGGRVLPDSLVGDDLLDLRHGAVGGGVDGTIAEPCALVLNVAVGVAD